MQPNTWEQETCHRIIRFQNGNPRQIPSPAIIQVEYRQVNINSSSWCLHCPRNPEKGILPFNPLWQDRWYLQPGLAPGKCFSRYQLRHVSSAVSVTCTCRTTGRLARSIFHLIAPLSIGALGYRLKKCCKGRKWELHMSWKLPGTHTESQQIFFLIFFHPVDNYSKPTI